MELLTPQQYQAHAGRVFDDVLASLAPVLPEARIEHVGASSIPGAISKGDLDVLLIVAPGTLEQAVIQLKTLGYQEKIDTLRTEQLCMLVAPRTDIDLALQVIEAGSRFEFFLHFRDALRADPALVAEYNRIKRETADAGQGVYRQAKGRFIEAVCAAR
jgi:GrpB-like predicted nucleotidyltransferase (UPF0157 family)